MADSTKTTSIAHAFTLGDITDVLAKRVRTFCLAGLSNLLPVTLPTVS